MRYLQQSNSQRPKIKQKLPGTEEEVYEELLFNFVCEDENILEMDNGDGCITL